VMSIKGNWSGGKGRSTGNGCARDGCPLPACSSALNAHIVSTLVRRVRWSRTVFGFEKCSNYRDGMA
jgi:hypothetical protein